LCDNSIHKPPASIRFTPIKHALAVTVEPFKFSPAKPVAYELSYTWRLALTVVDELAEFGAENTALFMHDEKLQDIVCAVLERFAGADVQVTDTTKDLLRAILKATLNRVFEAKDQLDIDNEWVEGLLNAVAEARVQSADPDNFLVGLFQGKGYPLLVGAVMETASGRLTADDAKGFEQAATTFPKDVAKIVGQQAPDTGGTGRRH
jgi:hypothetical protein